MESHRLGHIAEEYAVRYLEGCGYVLVERNFRATTGEIDLVAREGGQLCFIEVKARAADASGEVPDPFEAVDRRKQLKIIRTAQMYLLERHGTVEVNARFDVLAVYEDITGGLRAELLRNAFDAV